MTGWAYQEVAIRVCYGANFCPKRCGEASFWYKQRSISCSFFGGSQCAYFLITIIMYKFYFNFKSKLPDSMGGRNHVHSLAIAGLILCLFLHGVDCSNTETAHGTATATETAADPHATETAADAHSTTTAHDAAHEGHACYGPCTVCMHHYTCFVCLMKHLIVLCHHDATAQ
jgi:hypothetical protein